MGQRQQEWDLSLYKYYDSVKQNDTPVLKIIIINC